MVPSWKRRARTTFLYKKKKKSGWAKCCVRVAIVAWGFALAICGSLIFFSPALQPQNKYNHNSDQNKKFEIGGQIPGYQGLRPETVSERDHRHAAAKDNQAWLQRTFGFRPSSEQQQQEQQNVLPSWLPNRDHEKARGISSVDDVYIDPACRNFDHSFPQISHGCLVNKNNSIVQCTFSNLQVDTTKIHSSRGGEPLEEVMGRDEREEIPTYDKGAFRTNTKPDFSGVPSENRRKMHYMADVLNSLQYPKKDNKDVELDCPERWSGLTMFLTRYEYVNLYHTMTDWWNAYFSLSTNYRNTNDDIINIIKTQQIRFVFLDGHAQGNLDEPWNKLFGGHTYYVQDLPKTKVCFETAILVPAGYQSELFPQVFKKCPNQQLMEEFANFFLKSYGLQTVTKIPGKILIIDRQPYIAHPRSKLTIHRGLTNLETLKQRLAKVSGVSSVEVIRLETMPFEEQLRRIRETHILIGNHGAGLTHSLFMEAGKDTHVLEYQENFVDFFVHLCEWKNIQHTLIDIADYGAIPSDTKQVLADVDITKTVRTVEWILSGG